MKGEAILLDNELNKYVTGISSICGSMMMLQLSSFDRKLNIIHIYEATLDNTVSGTSVHRRQTLN